MKIISLFLFSLLGFAAVNFEVRPVLETDPISTSGDAADDTTVWIHPTYPEQSLIVGTNKLAGLVVFDLNGKKLAEHKIGRINNIDSRPGIVLQGKEIHLMAGSNRSSRGIDFYTIDGQSLELRKLGFLSLKFSPYGICMGYLPSKDGNVVSVFATSREGVIEQWDVRGGQNLEFTSVQSFRTKGTVEGCVVDDEAGDLYVSEETSGLWRFQLMNRNKQSMIDKVKSQGGNLTADIEGVAIYNRPGKTKYLVVSSQGDSSYHMYDLRDFSHKGRFRIGRNMVIDGVSDTDGIDIISVPLNDRFKSGFMIAQDGSNDSVSGSRENQNFKLVQWDEIEGKLRWAQFWDRH